VFIYDWLYPIDYIYILYTCYLYIYIDTYILNLSAVFSLEIQ